MWQCGIGMTPVVPSCPQVIPQVSSSPSLSLPWGHQGYLCAPQSPPASLPKADQTWLFPPLPTWVTLALHHGNEVIPSQVPHHSFHKFMGLFFHVQGQETEFRRVSFKYILWIEGKFFSYHTKDHPVTALSIKYPPPDSTDFSSVAGMETT